MTDPAETILNIPLFSGLSREDIAKVLGKLEEKLFPAGATIVSQGEKGDSFYIIRSGIVRVVREGEAGRSETIGVMGAQECFGEMALLSGESRSATIIAVKDTVVWRLSREDWDDLITKHPTWLLQFCATLSKRLTRVEQQYSQERHVFNTLAEEFYNSQPPEKQQFLRRAALLKTIDPKMIDFLLRTSGAEEFLAALEKSPLPFLRRAGNGAYELHGFFRDFLQAKFLATEGRETKRRLHSQLATLYEALKSWEEAIYHRVEAEDWSGVAQLLGTHKDELLNGSITTLKDTLDRIPPEFILSDLRLVQVKAEGYARAGAFDRAVKLYKEALSQRISALQGSEGVVRYLKMAEALVQRRDYTQALNCLRSGLMLMEQESHSLAGKAPEPYPAGGGPAQGSHLSSQWATRGQFSSHLVTLFAASLHSPSLTRWIGGVLGIAVWAYFWFWSPDIGLGPQAVKTLGLLCLTLIYWMFWVFPDYGVALMLALGLILAKLGSPQEVLYGFASTTWFMTLGVLALGAAITSSGLFYRLSLQLVRFFPLTYFWQTMALGIMGVVVTALIPQQSARTAISSHMLLNLTESLGYKAPSKASTGFFAATFLGSGQLGFLYLTGSTSNLLAWGLLSEEVREQFTWGYWFVAALPPALLVMLVVLASCYFLFRPDTPAQVSYKMVQNQLQILGPLSLSEWITLAALVFMVGGWLTVSYHGIDGAWISLAALCVLINTGVLGWGMMKKGIDWELLIYLGATLSIPAILTNAKIDQWLAGFLLPIVSPFIDRPLLSFAVIALVIYALKLVFTSGLAVITLSVLLIPLAPDMGVSPWVMIMIVLIATEVWFFAFQIDWHTLAYSVTEGKGFSYPLLCRLNPIYAAAYILALIAAIPYWRYLGLVR
ncbi:MAG TPA: SLC13 family permease [Candidatus Acidoferrales bacterium]|nr:SLC13 family permease [Candidatus Acidoferrales bacterium]